MQLRGPAYHEEDRSQTKTAKLLAAQLEYAVRELSSDAMSEVSKLKNWLMNSTLKEMRRRELENIESSSDLFAKQPIAYVAALPSLVRDAFTNEVVCEI